VLYLWLKAFHVIAVIAWMAGMLYLPRLFVYHCDAPVGSQQSETFKVMERRLLRAIMNPAMIAAYPFGITLVLTPGVVDWGAGWWHGKLLGIAAMTWIHHELSTARKAFAADGRPRTERAWRILNEVPTLALILIVVFGAFATSGISFIKMIGIGMGTFTLTNFLSGSVSGAVMMKALDETVGLPAVNPLAESAASGFSNVFLGMACLTIVTLWLVNRTFRLRGGGKPAVARP